ncbi:MAG TPA: adenine deaminase [Candidatus Coproplasma excrementavium]|nr:adenine deaminase [Candidatus Coproplasma excrementavium]
MAENFSGTDEMKRAADIAAGRIKADVVLKNARYLDVFNARLCEGDIALCGGLIAGIGSYEGEKEYDFSGKVVLPGLIDSHMHIESTQLSPEEFASLAVPRGTTLVIADPHEIVNVCGLAGADYMSRAAARTPLDVRLMLPSCVPATPFETSGAVIDSKEIAKAFRGKRFFGLGEMMNYPAVAAGDEEVLAKIYAAHSTGRITDGHAPEMSGKALNSYIVSGVRTDHECATAAEAEEKVSRGMYVLLREGSASHDLKNLLPAVNERNFRRFALCTDDRHADGLAAEGHIDHVLRMAVKYGLKGELAAVMCTLNAAECYGLKGKGAIAPGYDADLAVFDDVQNFNCVAVFKDGRLVAEDGKPLFSGRLRLPAAVKNTVKVAPVSADTFTIKLNGTRARVIGLQEGTLVTKNLVEEVTSRNGDVVLEGTDLLRLAVVERHFASGRAGLGLVKGYGLKNGAAATTVSHDSHNIIVVGDDKQAMADAVEELKRIGGGMTLVHGGKIMSVPLDIAGLMSSAPAEKHVRLSAELYKAAYEAGVNRGIEAFMTLSFLALAVIPELRLTDRGLFDVNAFGFTPIDAQ